MPSPTKTRSPFATRSHGSGLAASGTPTSLAAETQGQADWKRSRRALRGPKMRRIGKRFPLWSASRCCAHLAGFLLHGFTLQGLSRYVWGGLVRISSSTTHLVGQLVCHFFGSRRFATDDARPTWRGWRSIAGESWHHNHHAFPPAPAWLAGMSSIVRAADRTAAALGSRGTSCRSRRATGGEPSGPPGDARAQARPADRPPATQPPHSAQDVTPSLGRVVWPTSIT